METIKEMPSTIRNIKGTELPPTLRDRFNVKPHQLLKITVEVEEVVYLTNIYPKAKQADLTQQQKKKLIELIENRSK